MAGFYLPIPNYVGYMGVAVAVVLPTGEVLWLIDRQSLYEAHQQSVWASCLRPVLWYAKARTSSLEASRGHSVMSERRGSVLRVTSRSPRVPEREDVCEAVPEPTALKAQTETIFQQPARGSVFTTLPE